MKNVIYKSYYFNFNVKPFSYSHNNASTIFNLFIYIYIIIIRFRQCQGNCRISVAYRDNYPFINMISFIIYNSYK